MVFKQQGGAQAPSGHFSDLFNLKSKLCLSSEVSANPVQSSMKAEQSPQTGLKEGTPQLGFGQSYTKAPSGDRSSPPIQYAAVKTHN